MSNSAKRKAQTKTVVLGAMLTALVIILQFMGTFIRFGPFQISLVLVPIVIGAATCGVGVGAWLGLVFGAVVLFNGDATAFMQIDPLGTVITVLTKGVACGLSAGLVYKALSKWNSYLAVIVAAIVCPIVNTGVFLLGCLVFFLEAITEWGISFGYNNVVAYMFLGLVGGNFLVELASNVILSPIITRVLNFEKKQI
ncbi:MAG: ECF transporter S component [Clostridia bacterium]|nr:ECF transporter S component [Clostridia bacterium]MBQ4131387.1 ECF transporter S component [Clostridia bacterium]